MTTRRRLLPLSVMIAAAVLSACGGGGADAPTAVLSERLDTNTVPDTNTAPVANAGPAQSVLLQRLVTLDGSTSTDADSDTLGYTWTLTGVPAGSGAQLTGADTARPTFMPDLPGRYVATLTVNDGKSASTPAAVNVDAGAGNVAPAAHAGSARVVLTPSPVRLDGSGSTDANGDLLAYEWTLATRPAGSGATLTGANTAAPSFTADVAGLYVASLVVRDGTASSFASSVDITAIAQTVNAAPVAIAGPNNTTLTGRSVALDGTASYDVNGDSLTYAWVLTSRPGTSAANLTNAASGTPSLTPDQSGIYVATLVVSDGQIVSPPSTVVVTASLPPSLPTSAAIRAGGEALTTVAGKTYLPDGYYSGGNVASTTSPISGTPDDALYQRERYGEFSYSIPLADGVYQVTLHLAERHEAITQAGQRVFDVRFESGEPGDQLVADIDIYGRVGPNAAYDVDRIVTVRGGTLDMRFLEKVQLPKVAAITVVPATQAQPPPERIAARMIEVTRVLTGSAQAFCTDGLLRLVALDTDRFAWGTTSFPASGLDSVLLTSRGANFSFGSPGEVTLTYLSTTVSAATVTVHFGDIGTVKSIDLSREGFEPISCTPSTSAQWGVPGGDFRALVEGIEKPRPSYPSSRFMDCRYEGIAWGDAYPRTSEAVVEVDAYTLTFRPQFSSIAPSAQTWRDRNLSIDDAERDIYTLSLGAAGMTFSFVTIDSSAADTSTLTVSPTDAIVNARIGGKLLTIACGR
jgi:hypothetical protein